MADREQPYDPYIPSQSKPGQDGPTSGNQRTAALQAVRQTLAWTIYGCYPPIME